MSKKTREKLYRRLRAHKRVRAKAHGTPAKPRLCVFRSLNHIYAQAVDDEGAMTIAQASSLDRGFRAEHSGGGNVAAAKVVGKLIAERLKEHGVEGVVFDRGGYRYHGRVKALAEAAREAGLKF